MLYKKRREREREEVGKRKNFILQFKA